MALRGKIKDNLILYGFIFLLAWLLYLFINQFDYFDAPNLCYISLGQDVLAGNKKTMHRAIGLLKKTSRDDYKNLCRYVDYIAEKNCFAFDPRVEGKNEDAWQPGCFVKGSKTIYLKPEAEESNLIVKNRTEQIKKFMLMSKNFWESSE